MTSYAVIPQLPFSEQDRMNLYISPQAWFCTSTQWHLAYYRKQCSCSCKKHKLMSTVFYSEHGKCLRCTQTEVCQGLEHLRKLRPRWYILVEHSLSPTHMQPRISKEKKQWHNLYKADTSLEIQEVGPSNKAWRTNIRAGLTNPSPI